MPKLFHSIPGSGNFLLPSITHISDVRPTVNPHESLSNITVITGHEFTVVGAGYQVVVKFQTEYDANAAIRDLYAYWQAYHEETYKRS